MKTDIDKNASSTKTAATIAGGALVGNAVFNHNSDRRGEVAGTITIWFLIFGIIVAPFKYLGHVRLWLGSDASSGGKLCHVLLPVLSLFYGPAFMLFQMFVWRPEGWDGFDALMLAAGLHLLFGGITFELLGGIADDNHVPQQYGFGTAAYLFLCWSVLAAVGTIALIGNYEGNVATTKPKAEEVKVVKPAPKTDMDKARLNPFEPVALPEPAKPQPSEIVYSAVPMDTQEQNIRDLDVILNNKWKVILHLRSTGKMSTSQFHDIKQSQLQWISDKDKCKQDYDCIIQAYHVGIEILEMEINSYSR